MSSSERSSGADDQAPSGREQSPQVEVGPTGVMEASLPAPPPREPTGDDAVDEVLAQLDAVADQPLDSQIQMGERVHRVLQSRLADLGKE